MDGKGVCMHCDGDLGDNHRAVKAWFRRREHYGRACEGCWSRTLLGSLLYRADVCRREPCDCGWCAELKAKQEGK